jgi:hypothetical protein
LLIKFNIVNPAIKWHSVGKISTMNKSLHFKSNFMKRIIPIIAIAGLTITACNTKPDTARIEAAQNTVVLDTAGLAQFQAWKAQNEMYQYQQYGQQDFNNNNNNVATAPARQYSPAPAPARRTTSTARRTSSSGSGTASSGSGSTASTTQKKGISKAAKGAIIGGVAGGAAGAVINKKNRALGGVVGGVIGAGVGYGVGRAKDKKDGRY